MKLRILLPLVLILALSGCKTVDELNTEHWPVFYEHTADNQTGYGRHNLAGTHSGWENRERSPVGGVWYWTYGILSDIWVGDLQIRHVRKLWQRWYNFSRPDNLCVSGNLDFIELNGEINRDSVLVIERLLDSISPCRDRDTNKLLATRVYMNSNGGSLSDGYKLGEIFKKGFWF